LVSANAVAESVRAYHEALNRIPQGIPYARRPRTLPVVLGADEVVQFLEAVPSLKTRAALTTAYAAGLRASETPHGALTFDRRYKGRRSDERHGRAGACSDER
jgi:site-specific recombinase XerD